MVSWALEVLSGVVFFFFNDTATTEIYTLSLHDALPISHRAAGHPGHRFSGARALQDVARVLAVVLEGDRKSTRLNSSHDQISYAVFCLKKKINTTRGVRRATDCDRSALDPTLSQRQDAT